MARKIKSRQPDPASIPIVFGGSSCSGDIGASLIAHFPEVDFLIDGEGERNIFHLCRFLCGRSTTLPAKVRTGKDSSVIVAEPDTAPLDLNSLPYPDYSHYFQEMKQLFPGMPFIPLLPIEFSRGCWWNRCTFCNLNLQWSDYRVKKSDRMTAETLHLATTHECLHFTFTDNALPPREADQFFRTLSARGGDFDFFAEIRSITRPERLQQYSKAGLKTVQVGIEALSTSLLKKMAKGTTTMDNIAAMKMCSAAAIHMEGNLITDFPTTTAEEIAETLRNLDFVLPFLPLQAATFFLGYGSPIHAEATRGKEQAAIQSVIPHANNRRLFPESYLDSMTMLINSYRGDKKHQRQLWRPVRKKIRDWQNFHRDRPAGGQHPLQYRDGGTFLIIRQERIGAKPLLHRLRGLSRKIYLSCERPQRISKLAAAFPQVSEPAIRKFINDMCQKHLMFQENDRVLALAVHYTNG